MQTTPYFKTTMISIASCLPVKTCNANWHASRTLLMSITIIILKVTACSSEKISPWPWHRRELHCAAECAECPSGWLELPDGRMFRRAPSSSWGWRRAEVGTARRSCVPWRRPRAEVWVPTAHITTRPSSSSTDCGIMTEVVVLTATYIFLTCYRHCNFRMAPE